MFTSFNQGVLYIVTVLLLATCITKAREGEDKFIWIAMSIFYICKLYIAINKGGF